MKWNARSGLWLLALFMAQTLMALISMSQIPMAHAEDLKPEDLVAHHLESIGAATARTANKSRVVQGAARFKILVGSGGQLDGKGAVVSEGQKINIMMKFAADYKRRTIYFGWTEVLYRSHHC